MANKCDTCNIRYHCEGMYEYTCEKSNHIFYSEDIEKVKELSQEDTGMKKDMLVEIFENQKQLQENTMGYSFDKMTPQERARYIKDMVFWTSDEFSEMTHELPYAKDWSKKYDKPEYNHKKQKQLVKEELIDALHFFMNIMIAAGFEPKEIYSMYMEKNKENIYRQKRGY